LWGVIDGTPKLQRLRSIQKNIMKINFSKIKILFLLFFVLIACGQRTTYKYHPNEKDTIRAKSNFREFENKTIFEGDTLNGKVKTITQNLYGEYNDGSDVIYTFDEYGLQIRRQGCGQDIIQTFEGNKLIKSSICFADNRKEYGRNEFIYDERGNLIKHIYISLPNESINISDSTTEYYSYNISNKLIEVRKGKETIKYKYDEFDNCVREEKYFKDSLVEKIDYKYLNHRLEEKLTWVWFEGFGYYTRDENIYNADGTLKLVEHFVSETNDFLENSRSTTFYYYTYDNENRLVEFQEVNNTYYKKTITYNDFDIRGNWQVKNTNDNGRIITVKRRYEYFTSPSL